MAHMSCAYQGMVQQLLQPCQPDVRGQGSVLHEACCMSCIPSYELDRAPNFDPVPLIHILCTLWVSLKTRLWQDKLICLPAFKSIF